MFVLKLLGIVILAVLIGAIVGELLHQLITKIYRTCKNKKIINNNYFSSESSVALNGVVVYVGDIWTSELNKNPFERTKVNKFKVIDIKNNYIMYRYLEPKNMEGYESSLRVDLFISGCYLDYREEKYKKENKK